jgi:N-acetylglucosaminyldiphosphoundecaprenol N-acetyl-beta-D-mannosaminyltransferase
MDNEFAGEFVHISAHRHPSLLKSYRLETSPPAGVRRVELGGVRVDALQSPDLRELLYHLALSPGASHIATVNVEYLRRARKDSRLREIIRTSAVAVPDGTPVTWLLGLSKGARSIRATGHDLAKAAFELSSVYGLSLFFLGAAPGIGERAAAAARQMHPGISIAGIHSPPHSPYPFPPADTDHAIRLINESGADIVLAAFGCPKQDYWLADNLSRLEAKVAIGVGCVFDVLAGSVGRAPRIMQKSGLEWLYRLRQEPRRLLGRYTRDGLYVAGLALSETLGRARGGLSA